MWVDRGRTRIIINFMRLYSFFFFNGKQHHVENSTDCFGTFFANLGKIGMQHCVFEFQFASFVGVMCIFAFKYPGGCYRVFFILGGGGEFTHKNTDLTDLDFGNMVDLWDLSGIVWWILG